MRVRVWKGFACLLAVVVLGASAATAAPSGGDFTGNEQETRTLGCPGKNGNPNTVPKNQEPPGPGECGTGENTYQGVVWTNNVKCRGGEKADAGGVKVYQQGQTSGAVGICNDGTGPVGSQVIQGRASASGSATDGGTVVIDGDKDNSQHSALQGWAKVQGKPGTTPPTYRCGDDNGRKDSTDATSDDGPEDCG